MGPHFYAQGHPELFLEGADLRGEAEGGLGEAEAAFGRFEDRCCRFIFTVSTVQVTEELAKSKRKSKKEKTVEATIPSGPIRKSRRLMGEQPEIIPDEFFVRESHPYVPPKSEKEKLMEEEGTIVT